MSSSEEAARIFKTAWFARAARKARIRDSALGKAIREVMNGQADDLGGGVFKKRLDKNRHRAIILAKGGRLWVYTYLFAKKDRANIDEGELADFRVLAKGYASLDDRQIGSLLEAGELMDICRDEEA